jgi:hypothetical protein
VSSAEDVDLLEADARTTTTGSPFCGPSSTDGAKAQPRNSRNSSVAWRAPNHDCASGVHASRADRALQRSGRALSPSQRDISQFRISSAIR